MVSRSAGSSRKSAPSANRIVVATSRASDQLTSKPENEDTMKPAASTTVVVSSAWPTVLPTAGDA